MPSQFKIEMMHILEDEELIPILIEDIHNSKEGTYKDFLNIIEGKDISILMSPSKKDKLFLLQTIISYISYYSNLSDEKINEYIVCLVTEYNSNNIGYVYNNTGPLTHIYDNNHYKLFNKFNNNLDSKIIDFVECSYWLDMDKLMIYLYDKCYPEG